MFNCLSVSSIGAFSSGVFRNCICATRYYPIAMQPYTMLNFKMARRTLKICSITRTQSWYFAIFCWFFMLGSSVAVAGDGLTLYYKGVAALQDGDYDVGIADLTKSIITGDLSKNQLAKAYSSRAYGFMRREAYDLALRDLDTSLSFVPRDSWVLLRRCWVRSRVGNLVGAKLDCDAALANGADNVAVNNSIAELYAKLGWYERALKAYGQALEIRREPFILINRARLRARKGDSGGALLDYNEVIRDYDATVVPKVDLLFERAALFLDQQNYDDAISDYSVILSEKPDDAHALNNRCWSLAKVGLIREAITDCDSAIELRPDEAAFWDSRGFAYLTGGDFDRALEDLNMALRLEPRLGYALFHRGLTYEKLGAKHLARRDFANLAEIAPSWELAAKKFAEYGLLGKDTRNRSD